MSLSVNHVTQSDRAAPRPQFGLRALLLAITLISVVCAVFVAIGPFWSAMLTLAFSVIGLHVAGNAIGTRLQEGAPQALDEPPPTPHAAPETNHPSQPR